MHTLGQTGILGGVQTDLVAEVRQVCLSGLQPGNHVKGLFHTVMREVRAVTQGVENERVQVLQVLGRLRRQLGGVRDLGEVAYAEAKVGQLAVHHAQG